MERGRLYNIQDTRYANSMHHDLDGWIATRKHGKRYYAQFQSAGNEYYGNESLERILSQNPYLRAVPITKYAQRRDKSAIIKLHNKNISPENRKGD